MKTLLFALVLMPQSYEETTGKIAAQAEKAETGPEKVAVGDEFSKLLGKFPKKRAEILDAASLWYGKAWPDLDAPWKTKLRERLAKLYAPVVPGKAGALPEGWGGPVDLSHKATVDTTRVHSGGAAAKLIPGAKAKNARLLVCPSIELKAAKKIEFSMWILSDGTDSIEDHVRLFVEGAVTTKPILKDVPVWQKITYEVDVPADAKKAMIEVVLFSKAGCVLVDDLSIKVDGKELLKNGGFEEK